MAALPFGAAQSAAIMVEGERDSVRIQSPLMQINADTVCLVRTQFQHFIDVALAIRALVKLAFGLRKIYFVSCE
jgi:hypothetical protein